MRHVAGSGIVQRFMAFARSHELSGQTLGIALSGGPDSTALAIAAAEAGRAGFLKPIAIHVDHGVRADSHLDLPVIRDICARLSLELQAVRARLPSDASEDELRVERYRSLAATVQEAGGQFVMTAHHAGDQAETVLLHLIRGSGLEGVAGMAPIEHWAGQDGRAQLTVVRPLLLESRQDLLDLVEARGFPYLIDPTNADRDLSRNAIRHDVLPVLERIHAGAGASIARFAEIARADHLALQDEAAVAESRHIKDGKLMIADFRAVPTAIQRRIIRTWVKSRTGLDLPWNRTEAIRDATLVDRGGTIVELGEHWVARRAGKSIRISRSGER